jgi:hypothetical protein
MESIPCMDTHTHFADMLNNLKKVMRFKSGTGPGDCILVGTPSGLFFGLVRAIEPNQKKNWYNLRFTMLAIFLADITWILRPPQMNGEIFTINDKEHFVIGVDTNPAPNSPDVSDPSAKPRSRAHLHLAKKQQ